MAATFADTNKDRPIRSVGDGYEIIGALTLSGSYATGGETLDLASKFKQIGAGTVEQVHIPNKAGYSFEYDYTNKKVKVFRGDNANAAAAPEVELAAGAYPAALTTGNVPVRALGR